MPILLEKRVGEMDSVILESYALSSDSASLLRRPFGSEEMVLSYREYRSYAGGNKILAGGNTTPPKASWYLSEDEFRTMFASITALVI